MILITNLKKKLPLLCVILVAVGQFLCASGSGNPDTPQPLPDWINNSANIINIVIGLTVFIPRFRVPAAAASILITIVSIATNYLVDGYEYFLKVLAFDLLLLGVSLFVFIYYRHTRSEAEKSQRYRN